jgi:manganese transport protein
MARFRFGPGLLVSAAFIGPGTIVTASAAGAGYGAALLWAIVFSVAATIVLQDMAARVGIAGRQGLAESIRASIASPLLRRTLMALIAATILLGNAAFQAGNLLGASVGLNLVTGLPLGVIVALLGALAGGLLLTGRYRTIQNVLIALVGVMSVVFCGVAALTAPSLGELARGALVPSVPPGALLVVLALIGTTVVSYNLFLHASTALEQWPDPARVQENLKEARLDTICSVALGGLVTASVLVTAMPLQGLGANVDAAAVGQRLEPLLGPGAPLLFGAGLFAAGLTSSITAPLAAAYAAAGAFGWKSDLGSARMRTAWGFVLVTGLLSALLLGGSPFRVIVLAQASNALLLPLLLVFLLVIANRTEIMGRFRNSRLSNVLGGIVVLVIATLSAMQIARLAGFV